MWLYIHRVKRTASAEVIKNYLVRTPGFENERINVRELPTKEHQLKAFMVTAPLSRKDELYNPDIWPQNVGIKRFDFRRHKDIFKKSADFLEQERN